MRLEEILPAYRAGSKIKRKSWEGEGFDCSYGWTLSLTSKDLTADDWEVVEEYEEVEVWDWVIVDRTEPHYAKIIYSATREEALRSTSIRYGLQGAIEGSKQTIRRVK